MQSHDRTVGGVAGLLIATLLGTLLPACSSKSGPGGTQRVDGAGGGHLIFTGGVELHLDPGSLPPLSAVTISAPSKEAKQEAKSISKKDGPRSLVRPFAIHAASEPSRPVRLEVAVSKAQRPSDP